MRIFQGALAPNHIYVGSRYNNGCEPQSFQHYILMVKMIYLSIYSLTSMRAARRPVFLHHRVCQSLVTKSVFNSARLADLHGGTKSEHVT